jgi:hypothetical protein
MAKKDEGIIKDILVNITPEMWGTMESKVGRKKWTDFFKRWTR